MKQRIREIIVKMLRDELIAYIGAREHILIHIFREEMNEVSQKLNNHSYINIQLDVVGEHLIAAILRSIKRFLMESPE